MAITKKYVSLEKLGLYDEKIKAYIGSADAQVLADAKAYSDSKDNQFESAGTVATAKAELEGKIAAVQASADAADGKAVAAQGAVDDLEELVGTLPEGTSATSVVDYINIKTAGIATDAALEEVNGQISGLQTAVQAIQNDYLKTADKDALSGAIAAEKNRAEGIEGGLETRLAAVEADYLKSADKATLQGSIDAAAKAAADAQEDIDAFMKAAEVGEAAVDTLKEIQAYIESDGAAADEMTANIAANAKAIEDIDGRVETVEGAVETKAEQATVDAIDAAYKAADTGLANRIAALEAEVGNADGTIAEQISAAKQAAVAEAVAKDAALETSLKKYVDDEDAKIESRVDALEAASVTHALASDLTALAGRVTTAEGEIDTLQAEMDAVEAKAAANEAAISALQTAVSGKAAQADLDSAVARIAANEAAIAAFVEVSEEEINGFFK